jgi:hypothetical protein
MDKIKQIKPLAPAVLGHRVIVSDKVFSEIISTINLQTEVINALVTHSAKVDTSIETLENSLKNLANAIRNL